MQVELRRTQLFMPAQDCTGDPPTPSDSWRDMCSSLLHKTVSLFVFFFYLIKHYAIIARCTRDGLCIEQKPRCHQHGKEN